MSEFEQAVLNFLNSLSSNVASMLGYQQAQAQQSTLQAVQAEVQYISGNLLQGADGLAALAAQLQNLQTDVDRGFLALASAIARYSPNQTYVQLPPTPPAGYGGGSPGPTVDDVWNYVLPERSYSAHQGLSLAAALAELTIVQGGILASQGLYFSMESVAGSAPFVNVSGNTAPEPNWNNVGSYANVHAFLVGEWGGTWHQDANNLTWYQYDSDAHPAVRYRCLIDDATFAWLKARAAGGSTTYVPPVWPGLAHVTLGAPVAISEAFMVAGPMHGVIVDLTSVSPKKTTYDIDGQTAHRQIGSLVFVNDDGKAESFQALRFEHEVFVPKTFKEAANCFVQCDSSDVGTVTPWTITS
jgi:hypothetical protein